MTAATRIATAIATVGWLAIAIAACASAGCATLEGAELYQSGTRALRAGDAEAAVRDLERAAQSVPQASEIQNHLGLAYEAQGRRADALVAFDRALELDCDNQAAHINKARLRLTETRDE